MERRCGDRGPTPRPLLDDEFGAFDGLLVESDENLAHGDPAARGVCRP
jgi:hypothetical protein